MARRPNTHFSFKQFTIQQDRCAMKVCTDACLFGAWVANQVSDVNDILDIGTGTGLLSLMLAQAFPQAQIDTVEIDADAATQATENIQRSPWSNRISIHNTDVNHFAAERSYDLIISNPPFYEHDLKSTAGARNVALHSEQLTLSQLMQVSSSLLKNSSSRIAILLPYFRNAEMMELAAKAGLSASAAMDVMQTPEHALFRTMILLGKDASICAHSTVCIKEGSAYSEAFTALLRDYYLFL